MTFPTNRSWYTGDHIVWVGPWQDFTFDPINQKLKVGTETNDISFETPDSWLLDSWRTGAWQVHMLATPSVCKKCTFQEKRAWQLPEPATPLFSRNLKANYQGYQMVYQLFLCCRNFQK